MKRLCLAFVFGAQALFAQEIEPRLAVEFTDGSRLVGTTATKHLSIQTSYAIMNVPLARIRTVAFDAKEQTVNIRLQNDDLLTGRLALTNLTVKTVVGTVSAPVTKMTCLTVEGDSSKLGGLVLHFSFDLISGGAITDRSNQRHTGKATNCRVALGKVGNALLLEGANASVTFPDEGLPMGASPRTVAFWLKSRPTTVLRQVPFVYGQQVSGNEIHLVIYDGEKVLTIGNWGGSNEYHGRKTVADDRWHHAVLTYNGDHTASLYVDGELDISVSRTYNTTPTGQGWIPFTGLPNHHFEGMLDEFMIFD